MTNWREFYEPIVLTEEEIKEAIFEAKIKKHFREQNKEYWESQENGKTRRQLHESIRV
jgi:hypothetical protein